MVPYLLLAFLAATDVDLRTIEVDAGQSAGKIRSFQNVVSGPLLLRPGAADLGRQYKELRIDFVRAHDLFGPVDIDARWPDPDRLASMAGASAARTVFPDWSADPEREESYHFGPTDRAIQAIVETGAAVCYRIGRSWAADPSPPSDFDKYANIVKHVAMHYQTGWAHGLHNAVRYWEFWNEPDAQRSWNPQFIRPFWSGTPAQFYELYEKTARAIKSVDPQLQVGGPAKAAPDIGGPYREGFLGYCATHRVPLDFYSWHDYFDTSMDPYDLVRLSQTVRGLLEANGLRDAGSFVTEWNAGPGLSAGGRAQQSPMASAAFVGAALIYLQDSALQRACYYRGEAGPRALFQPNGDYTKNADVYRAAAEMLETPERLAVKGFDTIGFAVLAGKSGDGKKVRILMANYEIPAAYRGPRAGRARLARQSNIAYRTNRGYRLKIANLGWGEAAFRAKRYQLSDSGAFELKDLPPGRGGSFELRGEMAPPDIALLELERQ